MCKSRGRASTENMIGCVQRKAGKSPCTRLTHALPTRHCSFHTSITMSTSQQHREGHHSFSFSFYFIFLILHASPMRCHFRFEPVLIFTIIILTDLFQDDSFQQLANLWPSLPFDWVKNFVRVHLLHFDFCLTRVC